MRVFDTSPPYPPATGSHLRCLERTQDDIFLYDTLGLEQHISFHHPKYLLASPGTGLMSGLIIKV